MHYFKNNKKSSDNLNINSKSIPIGIDCIIKSVLLILISLSSLSAILLVLLLSPSLITSLPDKAASCLSIHYNRGVLFPRTFIVIDLVVGHRSSVTLGLHLNLIIAVSIFVSLFLQCLLPLHHIH